jgi:hypothetical protein
MNAFQQRHQNDLTGLQWVHRFRWLRTAELGKLMWPNERFARTRADRVAASWLDRKLVIARTLPNRAGRALVLSNAGAGFLRANGIEAQSGKDIGSTAAGQWLPPCTWQHDLIASGVLACCYESNYEIQTEYELRQQNPRLAKIPDGLAWNKTTFFWVEVEHAWKSGHAMQSLAKAICTVSDGQCKPVSGKTPNVPVVAMMDSATDERGYALNHQTRITRAIEKEARQAVQLQWAMCKMVGYGVSTVKLISATIQSSLGTQILVRLNNVGWREEHGCLVCYYDKHKAEIWEDDLMGWSYTINDQPAKLASNQTEAKHGCASWLAEITG